jgi:hypothetical protein
MRILYDGPHAVSGEHSNADRPHCHRGNIMKRPKTPSSHVLGSHVLDNTRRRFVARAGSAFGAVVLASLLPRDARSGDLPPVSPTEPTAQALGYIEDASKVDKAKAPTYVAGTTCATCNFYQGAAATGACTLFPGKSVSAKGWCAGYAKKA